MPEVDQVVSSVRLTEDGASDDYYRYLREKDNRKHSGQETDTLLSQELSFVREGLVIADLSILRKEGTFPVSERYRDRSTAQIPIALLHDMLDRNDMYDISGTDWNVLDQKILQFSSDNQAILARLGVTSIYDMDPAAAATLCYEIVKFYMEPDQEMADQMTGEAALLADRKTADQLIIDKKGICRHYTKVAVALYSRFKQIDKFGSLTDTALLPVGNDLMDEIAGGHAFCLLVAKRSETVLSIGDPTFYQTEDREVHTDLRLASLVSTIVSENLLSLLHIRRETLLSVINEQIDRINKRVNFLKLKQSRKSSTSEFISEQGFDERALHLVQESASVLQLVYALNTAKALLQDETSNAANENHMDRGIHETLAFLDDHSVQLSDQAIIMGISKIADICPYLVVPLPIVKIFVTRLLNLPVPNAAKTIAKMSNYLSSAFSAMQSAKINMYSDTDDIWDEPKQTAKYRTEELSELKLLMDRLANKWGRKQSEVF